MTMSIDASEARARARRLIDALVPLIDREIEEAKPKVPAGDRRMMAACKEVGAAVDRLLQAKFSPGEVPARKALEKSALRLRKELERQRHARK